jgi:hypothetical protein
MIEHTCAVGTSTALFKNGSMLLFVMLVPPTVSVKLSLLRGASFALLTTAAQQW